MTDFFCIYHFLISYNQVNIYIEHHLQWLLDSLVLFNNLFEYIANIIEDLEEVNSILYDLKNGIWYRIALLRLESHLRVPIWIQNH